MANLRLTSIVAVDSTTIVASFTENLNKLINTSNVEITSSTSGVPDSKVLAVYIKANQIQIKCRPLTPFVGYYINFQSTSSSDFKSINGSFLFEDGKTNRPFLLAPEEPSDAIRDNLLSYVGDSSKNIYRVENGTVIRDSINSQAINLSQALHDIGQLKNDNYLSFTVTDELKTRGAGPFDRLNEEGAYEVIRVSKKVTGSTTSTSQGFTSFPSSPISLLAVSVTGEQLVAGTAPGTFDGLFLNVQENNVSKLNSVIVSYQTGGTAVYDVETYGYQLLEPRYDEDYASPFFTLEINQIKLNENALSEGFVLPRAGDTIIVNYEYLNKGRFIDEDSVVVSEVIDVVREVTPPVQKQFDLSFAPIVSAIDVVYSSGGITFLDPSANTPFSATHPAFTKEIALRFDRLPSLPGEYAVDYESGRIFVYGAVTNDGTGDYPPVATYKYRKVYSSRLDYTYDSVTSEVVANPLRELIGETAKINFSYEEVLEPEVDYKAQIHIEVLDERVDNRLLASNCLSSLQSPITNVFRIFNETTGENYKITRWNNDKIYFSAQTIPKILEKNSERVSFTSITNELLITNDELLNSSSVKVFKILLSNNNIISSTEDCIASSFNTSVTLSRTDIFEQELYFDNQELELNTNIDRLAVGQYQVDYVNGIIYIAVSNSQNYDLGTVDYKKSTINPERSHVISVSELYHSIDGINVSKRINYSSFAEAEITPQTFNRCDERYLNSEVTAPYLVSSGTITVTDSIKEVRGIYDAYDLNNNDVPTNFAGSATVSGNVITLDSDGIELVETLSVEAGGVINASFITTGAEIVDVVSAVRLSDNVDLWNTPGTYSNYAITLNGGSGAVNGDQVLVTYKLNLNGSATPIVDYNRGEYFADYTFCADEILISYEYGDNVLDYRESDALNRGENYYVTYKVGALRDALLKNFGSLINLPILNTFDTSLPRERYRDALIAAMQSFPKGPTIPSIKAIVSNISHIDPELEEAAFNTWSLGHSYLYPNAIETSPGIQLVMGKYDYGALLTTAGETITFPVSSNLRLEEGTLEMWVTPQWDGLDNDATVTFSIQRDGYDLDATQIFIGSSSVNPEFDSDGKFTTTRVEAAGFPSALLTQTGCFVYYDTDNKIWKFYAKDLSEGHVYTGRIECSGEFYHVTNIPGLGELSDFKRSGVSKIDFEFHLDGYDVLSPDGYEDGYDGISDGYWDDGYIAGTGAATGYSFDGIQFMADEEHYLFDFGKTESTNRFSLYKDGRGYLTFRVFDRGGAKNKKNEFKVSADISDWENGENHHLAVSWRINSADRKDEMHLFIDGVEVPNIVRYGGRPAAAASDRFGTVNPEYVAGTVTDRVIAGTDLITEVGSAIVTSTLYDFQALGVVAGGSISINEVGFGAYDIIAVNGYTLTLSSTMPATLTDANYSVNEFSVVVATQVDLFNNIAVSVLRDGEEFELPGLRADIPSYSISKNALNQNLLTILGSANVGDQILIRSLGLNHRRCKGTQYFWGDITSVFKTQLAPPINLNEAYITARLLPLTSIGPANSVLSLGQFTATLNPTQPTNSAEGRTLSVRVTGSNVSFSTPITVTVNGTTALGPVFEVLSFTAPGYQSTVNKFKTITSAVVVVTPLITTKNSTAVEIKEAYPITNSEGNDSYPIIRYSYKTQLGFDLAGTASSATVTDPEGFFVSSNVGQMIVISSPLSVAGTYTIDSFVDENTITLDPVLPASFTGGIYSIFNTSLGRSGFQNGYFVLEEAGTTATPYPLPQGWYDFDYASYLEIPFDPISNLSAYIGSDRNGLKQAKAVIDEFRILSKRITDVRIGESLADNEDSVSADAIALRPFKPDSNTLMLLHFDSEDFDNEADFWVSANKNFTQAGESINSNFSQSLVINDKPIVVDNVGLLSTESEGSIEFWISPKYDTYNDPEFRFYFDSTGALSEEVFSLTSSTIKLTSRVSSVISVRLASDTKETGTDYFAGGEISSDFQTIKLKSKLPGQQTKVIVSYIPSGLSGDRISIYKDREGYICFNVRANESEFLVRHPVFWQRNTWHRVQATFKFNRVDNRDELRLFVDGEERGIITFGSGLLFGQGYLFGQGSTGGVNSGKLVGNIDFSDPLNEFFIGSDYLRKHTAYARIDNLRISNIARRPTTVAGQPKDINYSSNLDIVLPVVPDTFTTYLLNFDSLIKKADDFALLKNENFGINDFILKIIDSFGIVSGNPKIKQILEALIAALKPAQSRAVIEYID